MNAEHLRNRLTDDELRQFNRDGFFIVPGALDDSEVETLTQAVDRIHDECRPSYKAKGLKDHQPLNILDFIGKDDAFFPLLDWPKTFMKVVDILGWHIQLYHSHMIVTPPSQGGGDRRRRRLGWHQDSGRINLDIESEPRPRISLKVGYFLTDLTGDDRGNFHVIPGSHLANRLKLPDNQDENPSEAIAIRVSPGDAVFFDRRLWHAAGINRSDQTRKALFYGYSYRWLRPRDNMTVSHYLDRSDPVQKQLLGESPNGGFGYTSPAAEDVPLKSWIEANLGKEAVIP